MLGAGRPEAQVPLLAADRVVALTLGEGAPISEPLVGGPVGRGVSSREAGVFRGPVGGIQNQRVRARPLSLQVGKQAGGGTVTSTGADSNLGAESC